ncbi:hypothetical protein SAMN02745166_02206 [Prosthecobacter debontii]|uniref:DUF669 domain-containing protein n=1 Tax=Prosthecobacter debontii TaxID=48467 RepID=A0A1T4Y0I4_9BACT|nr:hypothetical protein [Prosthecobacter debontii]SKA94791.1 hypothetical protein SAMN02745166_02206 [Prosthecobacter debontii]
MPITFAAQEPRDTIPVLLEPGEYDFEIVDAREGRTDRDSLKLKAGTPKLDLKLRIAGQVHVYDHLFFAQTTYWKIDHLLKSIGKHPGDGEVIELDAFDLIGERGLARIKLGKSTSTGQPRNEVDAYVWLHDGDE